MDFVLATADVLVTSFVMFTLARVTLLIAGNRHGWVWVVLLFLIAIANMVIHRMLGTTINPPFYAALFFCLTLYGLDSPIPDEPFPWPKRGIYAAILGTAAGWLSFAQIVEM